MTKKQKNSKAGFTMVEIIAVLVIIGIMAAVAAPKFINMSVIAKQKAAVAGVSEAKASLSMAYAKEYLDQNGVTGNITMPSILAEVDGALVSGGALDFGDIEITFVTTTSNATLTVTDYQGDGAVALEAGFDNTWTKP